MQWGFSPLFNLQKKNLEGENDCESNIMVLMKRE
jgi:hypothetical protein